ncbi:MAG: hypothetical protein ACI9UA_005779, partial [Pseudoalteromonas tetraodonis]
GKVLRLVLVGFVWDWVSRLQLVFSEVGREWSGCTSGLSSGLMRAGRLRSRLILREGR